MSKPTLLVAFVTACSMGLAGGCVDWSKDVARYRQVLDGQRSTTRPVYSGQEPLSLVEALRIANADNETIASSGEDYIQALAEKMRQAGTFLPTLSLAPSYRFTRTSGGGGSIILPGDGGGSGGGTIIETGGGGTAESASVTAGASLSTSLANLSNLAAAAQSVEQRAQLLLDTREAILLQVVQAYYDVLRNEKQVEVLRNSVALRQEQVRDQETRLQLGNARTLDLAQSQADLAATRVSLAQAETNAANARSALARQMGVDAVEGELIDAFTTPADVRQLAEWRETALRQRQDLLAAAQATETARIGVEAAIRRYFPSVSINYNYFLYNDPDSNQTWTGGISANLPIFSGLQIEADIRSAWSRYRQAALAESQRRRIVLDDIAQAFRNLSSSREKIAYLQVQVEAARRAFELSDRAYRLGAESNLNRLIQQDNLLSAELNLIDEQFNEKTGYLSLLRSSGQLATILHDAVADAADAPAAGE